MRHRFAVTIDRLAAGSRMPKSTTFKPGLEGLEARIALAGDSGPGMEIAYLGNVGEAFKGPTEVYLAAGTNPISADAWATYTPPPNYLKNTSRNVEFNSAKFLTSPDSATENTFITTADGYTWQFVTETVSANYPFDPSDYPDQQYTSAYEAAAFNTTPPPGVIRYSANTKNAITTWLARNEENQPIQRFFIRDPWQNLYIMQTSGVANEADVRSNFYSASLPPGWVKFSGYLRADLTTTPAYDSQGFAQYNIFRNSADDAFQQVTWSGKGIGIAQQIADMPIWGGPSSDKLLARRSSDSLIHGAQGNDTFRVYNRNDTIHGDAGTDTVVFAGLRRQYMVKAPHGDRSTIVVERLLPKGGLQTVTLHDVERIRFADKTVSTGIPKRAPASFPSPRPLWRSLRPTRQPRIVHAS